MKSHGAVVCLLVLGAANVAFAQNPNNLWSPPAPVRTDGTSLFSPARLSGPPMNTASAQPTQQYATPNLSVAAQSGWEGAGSCGVAPADCGCSACCLDHYIGVSGLYMTRDRGNKLVTTYESGNNPNQLLHSQDASGDWGGGFEIVGGWNVCCDNAIEINYYGVWGIGGEAGLNSDSTGFFLSTPLDTNFVTIAGNPAGNYFDGAREHRLTRDDEFHNVEVNWIYHALDSKCNCNRLRLDLSCGVRYFRFSEEFEFASLAGAANPGTRLGQDPANEAYLNVDVENNLVGFQIGSYVDWRFNGAWAFFATPKVGLYGNHVTGHSRLSDGNGTTAVFTDSGHPFDLSSTKNDVAILASFDLGLNWDVTSRWSIYGGYRVVAVTGVALSDNQVYPYLAGETDFLDLDTNGSLILHGVFVGTQVRF